jgi:hypothetical protein
MARFTTTYFTPGAFADGVFSPTGQSRINSFPLALENNEPGTSFSPGDVLTATNSIGTIGNGWLYVGFYGAGVVVNNSGNYHYFSTAPLPSQTAFPVNTTGSFVTCFLAGTLISTVGGPVAVEALRIGDGLVTANGHVVPVKWIGRQTVVTAFGPDREHGPVLVCAGALGPDLPVRDLCVSPDHALLVDGVLVQAGALVNGTTIARMADLPERFTYYHVELDDHSLILAEGVPAETFVDNVTRRRFHNYAEYEARYGESVPSIAELALPRIKSARQLPLHPAG